MISVSRCQRIKLSKLFFLLSSIDFVILAYANMMEAYNNAGASAEVFQCLRDMKSQGIPASAVHHNLALRALRMEVSQNS